MTAPIDITGQLATARTPLCFVFAVLVQISRGARNLGLTTVPNAPILCVSPGIGRRERGDEKWQKQLDNPPAKSRPH